MNETNNTIDDTNDTNDNTINTANAINNITSIEIFSEDYSIIENNDCQTEDFDLSSTNISNEIVNKYFNKLNMLVNINIQKSINWCKKHQFIINKEFILKY